MLDVKQTLKDAEERMESAILYLDEELPISAPDAPTWRFSTPCVWILTDRKCH